MNNITKKVYAWIVATALPVLSIVVGVLGIVAINVYNMARLGNHSLGIWAICGILTCALLSVMGLLALKFWE